MERLNGKWLSIPEGAKYARVDTNAFRKVVQAGKVPGYVLEGSKSLMARVNTIDIDAWLRSQPTLQSIKNNEQ